MDKGYFIGRFLVSLSGFTLLQSIYLRRQLELSIGAITYMYIFHWKSLPIVYLDSTSLGDVLRKLSLKSLELF